MEVINFISSREFNQFILGQIGSTCVEPSLWQYAIIITLVAGSGIAIASTGIGFVAIVNIIVPLIIAGGSIEAIMGALGAQLTLIGGSVQIVADLIHEIERILGC